MARLHLVLQRYALGHVHCRRVVSNMPIVCNRWMVFFRCAARALAFRSCVNANCAAIFSAWQREQRPLVWPSRHHRRTSVRVAVRTWATVRSGFFPPVLLSEFGQEQMADAGQDEVVPDSALRY